MSDWAWLPVGAMATPTLRKDLKPLFSAVQARRGGGGRRLTFSGAYLEEEIEGVEGTESDDSSDDNVFIIASEEKE